MRALNERRRAGTKAPNRDRGGPFLQAAICAFLVTLFSLQGGETLGKEAPSQPSQIVHISGRVVDPHLEPVKEARISVRLDGQGQELVSGGKRSPQVSSDCKGWYLAEFSPSSPIQEGSKLELEVTKPGFMSVVVSLEGGDLAQRGEHFYFTKHISLPRRLGPGTLISSGVFLVVYLLMAFELVHRTVAAMAGAVFLLLVSSTVGIFLPDYRIISFSALSQAVDLNVIALILGAMLAVGAMKGTGIFDWIVAKCFLVGRFRIQTLSALLVLSTAAISAFVDNVAAIIVLAPMSIKFAQALKVNPVKLLIPQVLASNLGGTATLIGDTTNVMIGSASGLSFVDFLENLGPLCGLALVALLGMTALANRERIPTESHESLEEELRAARIKDKRFLIFGLLVGSLAVALLLVHGSWGMEPCIPVLGGGAVLFIYGVLTRRLRMLEFLEREVEWPLLLFLFCLFWMVAALEESGALFLVSEAFVALSHWDPSVAISLLLWGSALMAAFVDNLPLTAAMLPVVSHLSHALPEVNLQGFWWALALGVSLGGNGTVVGGSANMVAMGMANSAGYPVSFAHFLRLGFPYMILSVAISNAWLLAFYK